MIYTVFTLLNTSKYIPGRRFGRGYIKSVRKCAENLIDLTDESFENGFKGSQDGDAAWKFLSSIAQMFDKLVVEEDDNSDEDDMSVTDPQNSESVAIPSQKQKIQTRDTMDDRAIIEAMRKEQITNDNLLLDDNATRMTNNGLDNPTKDKKIKVDDAITNKLGYN